MEARIKESVLYTRTKGLKFNLLNLLNKNLPGAEAVRDSNIISCLQNSSEFTRIVDIQISILQWYKRLPELKQEFYPQNVLKNSSQFSKILQNSCVEKQYKCVEFRISAI